MDYSKKILEIFSEEIMKIFKDTINIYCKNKRTPIQHRFTMRTVHINKNSKSILFKTLYNVLNNIDFEFLFMFARILYRILFI